MTQVTAPGDMPHVRRLFEEYAAWLGADLCFQNFASELATLPGAYAPPAGRLFLCSVDGQHAGCVALRPFSPGIGEVKRLYVRPEFRQRGIGRRLVATIIDSAREIGYRELVLDTLTTMRPAMQLYESFGFIRAEPYYENPLPDVAYFRLHLTP